MFKKSVVMLISFILLLTLSITPNVVSANESGYVSVKLVRYIGNQTTITFNLNGSYILNNSSTILKAGQYSVKRNPDYSITLSSNNNVIGKYQSIKLTPSVYGESTYITFNNMSYLGDIEFVLENGYIRPINTLPFNDYLKGVVPTEMSASWPVEALKAQAVTARTFAATSGMSVDDTTSYQAYKGYLWKDVPYLYVNSNLAVDETRGEVLKNSGNLIYAGYSASNGGMVFSNKNSWGTTRLPYLVKKSDPYDLSSGQYGNPNVNWDFTVHKTQINLSGKDLKNPASWWNSVQEVDKTLMSNVKKGLVNYGYINASYEVKIVRVPKLSFMTTFNQEQLVTGSMELVYLLKNKNTDTFVMQNGQIKEHSLTVNERSYNFRSIFSTSFMLSPYVKNVNETSGSFTVNGGGWGHNIGMSQWGAHAMAKQGFTYRDILDFYYPSAYIDIDGALLSKPKSVSVTFDKDSPSLEGTPVTFTANAVGGADNLYKFWIVEDGKWKALTDFTSSNTFTWSNPNAGNYSFSVHVKDRASSNNYDAYKLYSYVTYKPIEVTNVVADKPHPQPATSTIKLTAYADGGTERLYQFWAGKDGEWVPLSEYSKSNTFDWTPSEPGNYTISVYVKNINSNNNLDAHMLLNNYVISEEVVMNKVDFSLESPQKEGTSVTLTADASGGVEKEYKFWVEKDGKWEVLRDYSPSNSITWTPNEAGTYGISVQVKDTNSTEDYDDYKYFQYEIEDVPVVMNMVDLSVESPQKEGTSVTLTADASGGVEKEYKFWLEKDGQWEVLRDYSASNSITWTPKEAGTYGISVYVRDTNSTKVYDDYKYFQYEIEDVPVVMNKVDLSVVSPQKEGTSVTLTADASGGVEKEYKFWLEKNGKWEVLKDYSASNSITWTPKEAGTYGISVYVRDTNSTEVYDDYKYFQYEIEDVPVVMNKVDLSVESPQKEGTSVTLTADASGGVEKEYKFWVEKNGKWEVLRDYSASNSITWTPKEAGTYGISVYVRDTSSMEVYDGYKYFQYEITNADPIEITKINFDKDSPQSLNTSIKITTDATGGTNKVYKYWVVENGRWKVVRDYDSSNSFTWTPTETGNYSFSVHVKDLNSTNSYDDYKLFKYIID